MKRFLLNKDGTIWVLQQTLIAIDWNSSNIFKFMSSQWYFKKLSGHPQRIMGKQFIILKICTWKKSEKHKHVSCFVSTYCATWYNKWGVSLCKILLINKWVNIWNSNIIVLQIPVKFKYPVLSNRVVTNHMQLINKIKILFPQSHFKCLIVTCASGFHSRPYTTFPSLHKILLDSNISTFSIDSD